jgi:hypothetical protein
MQRDPPRARWIAPKSGKGGYHRIYKPKFDEKGFRMELAKSILSSLMKDFLNETTEVITNYIDTRAK